jgi:hypothetical protein
MIRRLLLFLILLAFSSGIAFSQSFVKTSDLFVRTGDNAKGGNLIIVQNPAIDSLISRYILMSKKTYDDYGHYGMAGFRIQIYNSNNRNAREESNKANAEFIGKFPDIRSYSLFAQPGYYKIRVGDFRTKGEATRLFLIISKVFPDAYIVPDVINFPDVNKK